MDRAVRWGIGACAAAAVLLLAGCKSDPAQVSKSDFQATRRAQPEVTPGMPRDDVLQRFRKANTTKLSEATVGGVRIEEWRAEAKRGSGSDTELFVAFLYFGDGLLLQTRDQRWDYRAGTGPSERPPGG